MLRTVLSFSAVLGLLFGALPPAPAQQVVSAKAGMIHYAEGKVLLDGQEAKINAKSGNFPSMKNDSVLRTELGRAEVLLAPGMFIRLGEDTTIRMPSTALTDIRVELVEGSVLLEVTEFDKENAVTLRFKNAVISPVRSGLYRLDAQPAELRVFEGKADVVSADKTLQAKKGQRVTLEGELLAASKFDTENTDTLHRWANRRAGYLAMANIPAARALRDSDALWTTSGWMWNPYFGMYTFIPRNGMLYSPFGYAFYSPRVVYAVYQPRDPVPSGAFGGGGMGGGGPVYNPNLGYSTGSSRSYGGYQGAAAGPAPAAAPAPAPSVRSGEGAAARGEAGGGRSQ